MIILTKLKYIIKEDKMMKMKIDEDDNNKDEDKDDN